jgi:hypothetical protein
LFCVKNQFYIGHEEKLPELADFPFAELPNLTKKWTWMAETKELLRNLLL